MNQSSSEQATYASAGVNIEAGNEVVRRIKPHVQRTRIPGVLGGIGGFGGLFQPDLTGMSEPVLVRARTASAQTESRFALNKHDTIGQDVVAMNVNDVLCCGARPLFFLDYLGIGQLEVDVAEAVIKGVADGCADAGCALIGGETAELPGLYSEGEYDLVGCCVGMVDKNKIIDGSTISPAMLSWACRPAGCTPTATRWRAKCWSRWATTRTTRSWEQRWRSDAGAHAHLRESLFSALLKQCLSKALCTSRRWLLRKHSARAAGGNACRHPA
jgi:hypothetical protein